MSASRPCLPRRLLRQLQEGGGWLTLRSDKGEDIIAVARPTDDTLTQWKVAMRGPELSDMLRNELFTLEVVLPDEFPMVPPKVRIVNEHLIHPNIAYKTGVVAADFLADRWSPWIQFETVLRCVQVLLDDPSFSDSANGWFGSGPCHNDDSGVLKLRATPTLRGERWRKTMWEHHQKQSLETWPFIIWLFSKGHPSLMQLNNAGLFQSYFEPYLLSHAHPTAYDLGAAAGLSSPELQRFRMRFARPSDDDAPAGPSGSGTASDPIVTG